MLRDILCYLCGLKIKILPEINLICKLAVSTLNLDKTATCNVLCVYFFLS